MEDEKNLTEEEFQKFLNELNDKSQKPTPVDLSKWINDSTPKKDFSDILTNTKFSFDTYVRLPNEKRFFFSSTLTNTPFSRIDIISWQYALNFLLNYCSQFLSTSENEEVKSLIKSNFLKETIELLFYKEITLNLLKEIISKNKPFFSFNANRISLLRRNALFIKVYLETIEHNYKSRFVSIDKIAKYFIYSLVSHEFFFEDKACQFLNKEYSRNLTKEKLATIKYFNDEVLGQLENLFVEQNLDFSWLKKVRNTYVDKFGKAYTEAADQLNHRIQKWTSGATSGVTVAGGNGMGNASDQFNNPTGISVDGNENLYITDWNNQRVQKWAAGSSNGITVAGGNGRGTSANQLNGPPLSFVDSAGNIYVADGENDRIQKWTPGATSGITVAGGNGRGNAPNQFYYCYDVSLDRNGNMYVSDRLNHRIQKFAPVPLLSSISYTPLSAGHYTALVTSSTGCQAISNEVEVYDPSAIKIIPANDAYCLKNTPRNLTVAGIGTGGGSFTYQWYINTTNSNIGGTIISGATLASYAPSTISAGTSYYYVEVVTQCGTLKSLPVEIIVSNSLYYRSSGTGNWNDPSIWQVSSDNINFANSTTFPNGCVSSITIRHPDIVTVTANAIAIKPTVNSGAALLILNGVEFITY